MADITKNIFISHVHEDDEGLGKLKDLLKRHGMTVRDYSISADKPNNAHEENYIKYDILAPKINQSSCFTGNTDRCTRRNGTSIPCVRYRMTVRLAIQ